MIVQMLTYNLKTEKVYMCKSWSDVYIPSLFFYCDLLFCVTVSVIPVYAYCLIDH